MYVSRMYIDAHCHLTDTRLDADRERLIGEMQSRGISKWILGGVDSLEWPKQIALSTLYPESIVTVFGIHPWTVAKKTELELEQEWKHLEELSPLMQGIGETGLDFAPKWETTRDKQEIWFRKHLELQKHLGKPMVLHVVRAHQEALKTLEHKKPTQGGLVHAFTGDSTTAKKYLGLGFLPSIGSRVTFEKSTAVRDFVKRASLNEFVLETDCPDQPPEGHPNSTHGPETLFKVAKTIADIRGMESAEEILAQSAQNLVKLFSL